MRKIRIFLDGADRELILKSVNDPQIQGYTTNPTLMRKAGVTDYEAFCRELATKTGEKPISFEVFADDFVSMHQQALKISSWGKNVYVKIPVLNTQGESTVPLIRELAIAGVQMNVTAVFTTEQVYQVAQALTGGPRSVVSVFAGRIADAGVDPCPLMFAASKICRAADPRIELLWASPREALNILQAEQSGCDIITLLPELLSKVSLFGKDLHQFSLETSQMFRRDALAAGYTL